MKQGWINKSIDQIFEDYLVDKESTIVLVENNNNNSHQDLIDQEYAMTTPNKDDIVIIKDIIANNKYQHTGYIFNGSDWVALDGNYSAENIYFDEDFIFTEDIGTITIPESGSVTVSASGKNLKEFLSTLFAKEENPIITMPSASIKLNPVTTEYEVGTVYTPKYSITFNPGSYSFGPDSTGVVATYEVEDTFGNMSSAASGSFTSFDIKDDTSYAISAKVSHSDGVIPKTNLQNNYLDGQITANTLATISTNKVKGYRNYFYGTTEDKGELNSEIIRNLKGKSRNKTFSINVPENALRVLFAFPKVSDEDDFVSAKNVNAMNGETKPRFKKQIVSVYGANDKDPIDYNVFVLDYVDPTTVTNVYDITL